MLWLRYLVNGSLWSIAGVAATLAIFYWQETRNAFDLTFQIEDEVNLVEVREAVPELRITYKDADILNAKRELKLVRLRVLNRGETILQSHFDQKIPFNISFPGWRVLDASVDDSNSEYLKGNMLKKNEDGKSRVPEAFVTLNPIIFERGKYAVVKVYLLQETEAPLKASVSGKIANIDTFEIDRAKASDTKYELERFLAPLLIGYVGVILGMMSLVLLILTVEHFFSDRPRKKRLDRFLAQYPQLSAEQNQIAKFFRKGPSDGVIRLLKACRSRDDAFDMRSVVSSAVADFLQQKRFYPFLLPLLLRRTRELSVLKLPPEIFIVNDARIRINPANKDFVFQIAEALDVFPKAKAELAPT